MRMGESLGEAEATPTCMKIVRNFIHDVRQTIAALVNEAASYAEINPLDDSISDFTRHDRYSASAQSEFYPSDLGDIEIDWTSPADTMFAVQQMVERFYPGARVDSIMNFRINGLVKAQVEMYVTENPYLSNAPLAETAVFSGRIITTDKKTLYIYALPQDKEDEMPLHRESRMPENPFSSGMFHRSQGEGGSFKIDASTVGYALSPLASMSKYFPFQRQGAVMSTMVDLAQRALVKTLGDVRDSDVTILTPFVEITRFRMPEKEGFRSLLAGGGVVHVMVGVADLEKLTAPARVEFIDSDGGIIAACMCKVPVRDPLVDALADHGMVDNAVA
ncbi:MAG: hypothetical protein AAB592_01305 [Patescibacteria group bacterium]